jgi:cytoplasmic iron level regulating protein YaaA (DUF328/UPF0246 family)
MKLKIILSPSKTMNITTGECLEVTDLIDQVKTKKIVNHIKRFSKKVLKQKMSLSDKLIEEVYPMYQSFESSPSGQAIHSYTGFVFKKLDFSLYTNNHYQYMENHIRILDALYGVLKPSTLIKQYRLDFHMKIGLNLYEMWNVSSLFHDEEIINLASNEYRKMLNHKNIIDISFYQKKGQTYKNIPTHTKQARGMMLHYMITHQIVDIEKIKQFDVEGYQYSEDLSSAQELVFIR